MKLFSLVLIAGLSLADVTAASNCKGHAYTSLDNGDFVFEKVKAEYIPMTRKKRKSEYVRFVFIDDYQKPQLRAYRYTDDHELLQARGFYDLSQRMQVADIRFDRSTISMLKDRAVIGFNLLCLL